MKYFSFLSFLLLFISLNAASQKEKNDLLFAGTPNSFTILTIKTGDSISFKLKSTHLVQKIKITRIDSDTIFYPDGIARVSEILEIRLQQDNYHAAYLPAEGQISVPPVSIYASPQRILAFKEKLSNQMGFYGSFPYGNSGFFHNNHLTRMIYLRYLPTHDLFKLSERQIVQYTIPGQAGVNEGRIFYISHDTLFFDGLTNTFRNFNSLKNISVLPGMHPGPGFGKAPFPFKQPSDNLTHKPSDEVRTDYSYNKADSANWKVLLPPDSIYYTSETYRQYNKYILRAHKREIFRITNDPMKYRNAIRINLAKILHCELALSYERVHDTSFTWEVEAGYIIGFPNADAYYTMIYPLYNYSGFFVQTMVKYFWAGNGIYLAPVLLYRNLWFKGVRTDFPYDNSNGRLQDQARSDYGISIRFGKERRYGHFTFDYYAGLGIKLVVINIKDYGRYLEHDEGTIRWYHDDHSPDLSRISLIHPVFNLGIKIGGAF